MVGVPFKKIKKIRIFRFSDMEQHFLRMIPYVFLYFWSILEIVGRSTGLDFEQIFEIPKII